MGTGQDRKGVAMEEVASRGEERRELPGGPLGIDWLKDKLVVQATKLRACCRWVTLESATW